MGSKQADRATAVAEVFESPEGLQPRPPGAEPSVAMLLAERNWHLERALLTRTVIGEAKGILMERYSMTAEEAFDVLREVSSSTGSRLCDVADELVRTRSLGGMVPTGEDEAADAR